jgi:hypothetical protein
MRQDEQLHDRHDQHLRKRRPIAHDVERFSPRQEKDSAHG